MTTEVTQNNGASNTAKPNPVSSGMTLRQVAEQLREPVKPKEPEGGDKGENSQVRNDANAQQRDRGPDDESSKSDRQNKGSAQNDSIEGDEQEDVIDQADKDEQLDTDQDDQNETEQELSEWSSLEELREAAGLTPEQFENLKWTRKVNGKDEEVTLSELRANNQRDADYTQKTMKLSEERKAFEKQRSDTLAALKTQNDELAGLIAMTEKDLVGDYQSINWKELEETDPARFASERVKFQERYQKLQIAKQSHQARQAKINEDLQAERQKQFQTYLGEQQNILLSKFPTWSDQKVKEKEQGEMRTFLSAEGFTDEEIAQVYDYRHVLLIRDAMAYRKLKAGTAPKLQKVKTVNRVLKPKTVTGKQERNQAKVTDAKQRFDSAPSLKGVAAVLAARRNNQ